MRATEAKYRDVFEGALEGMFQVSPNGRLIDANRSAATMLGFHSVDELISKSEDFHASLWHLPCERSRFTTQFEEHGFVRRFECRLKRKDNTTVLAMLSCRKVHAPDGTYLYSQGFFEDITDLKHAELSLSENQHLLQEAEMFGHFACYVHDINTGAWTGSAELDLLFGVDDRYRRDVAGWEALIHPDDRAMMSAYFADEVVKQRGLFDKAYRIIRHADKEERWVHGTGWLEYDAQGRPQTMHGLIKDITEQKRAEMKLLDSEERYRMTFEQAPVGIIHVSFEGRVLRCNPRFAEIIGYPLEHASGISIAQITRPEDRTDTFAAPKPASTLDAEASSFEQQYVRMDGTLIWVKVTASIQRDRYGRALHYIVLIEDIHAQKQGEERLWPKLQSFSG